jgi:formyltetrahydrofolate deformylase
MSPSPTRENIATLLVTCPDRKGLVAALAQLLYGHGCNLLDSDQHSDPTAGKFFQRIRLDMTELHGDRHTLQKAVQEVAERFSMDFAISFGDRPKRAAILVSKFNHCLHDLLLRHAAGELPCEIPLILSNHQNLESIAQHYSIPYHVFPQGQMDRSARESAMAAMLTEHNIDVLVLARYMQILSADFCQPYQNRVINIHHSFLPAFVGSKPYHQAHRRGVKIIGATAHYVTQDLDEGPIIEQDVMHVSHRDTVKDLIRKGRDLERLVLSRAVRHHLEDRVLVYDNKTVVFE